MIRAGKLSNKFQKRTLRVVFGQTQAYPYSAVLDSTFRAADGSIVVPVIAGSANPQRQAPAFLLKGGLVPGTVVVLNPNGTNPEGVKVACGEKPGAGPDQNVGETPFGLLANFVGGELDEVGDNDEIGVWRSGQGGVFELLAPAFGTVAQLTARAGQRTPLYAGTDGRVTTVAPDATSAVVANLLAVFGTSRILIDLKV